MPVPLKRILDQLEPSIGDVENRPIPIAFVITELDPGGAERQLVSLATRVDRARWAPHVISLQGEGALADSLRSASVPVTCLHGDSHHAVRLVRKLSNTLRKRQPRLVQSFLFHANLVSRIASRVAGIPHHLGGVRVSEPRRSHLRLERVTQSLGHGSVCVSESVRRYMQREAGIGSDRLVVIRNAVDVDAFSQATPVPLHSLDIPDDSFMILFVGRLEPQKSPDTLIELLDVLVRNWSLYAHSSGIPFASVHLALAGEGPLREKLEADVAKREALRGLVHFLGQRSDIPGLLKTANVLVLPSEWEGMPNVILEAMAAGTPVIARDLPELRELIDDGRTGDLVPHNNADDPAMWRLPILKLLGHPDRAALQVNAAQEYVRNHHSPASMVRAYERLWTAVLASGQHRTRYRRGP